MADRLRIGVAGVGAGARGLVENISKLPGYELTAAADVRSEPLDRLRSTHRIEAYDDVLEMCKSPNVDVVYVATPNQFHCEHVVAAAQNGKHILCEKIMAVTYDEARTEVEAAEANGVKFLTVHRVSSRPPIEYMWRFVEDGRLGRPIQITNVHYSPWLLRPRLPEEYDTSSGGGIVYRQAPYHVDMARLMAGGIVRSVRASVGRHDPEHPLTEGDYSVFLDFENGAAANLVYNAYGFLDTSEATRAFGEPVPDRPGWRGLAARATLAGGATKEDMRTGDAMAIEQSLRPQEPAHMFFGLTIVSCEHGDMRQTARGVMIYDKDGAREVELPLWDDARAQGLQSELEELHAAVTEDRPILHDGRWGAANVEVCDAIIRSSRERREVLVSHQVPPFGAP